MTSTFNPQSLLQKANLLLDQQRYQDAATIYEQILAQNPQDAYTLYLLSTCQYYSPKKLDLANQLIDQAIGYEPNEPAFYNLKAMIMTDKSQAKKAVSLVETAITLNPLYSHTFAVKAYVQLNLEKWSLAEGAARKALSLDPENLFAGNLLASSLRMQNRIDENKEVVMGLLAKDPSNAISHANAGWVFIHKKDYKRAQMHFQTALKIDPQLEPARSGMLETLKVKSPLYRWYLNYALFMSRQSRLKQFSIIIAIIIGARLISGFFKDVAGGRFAFVSVGVIIFFYLFIFWSWLANGVGNLIVLLDPYARLALKKEEKLDGIFVGGSFLLGLIVLMFGMVGQWMPLMILGGTILISAIPFSCAFVNKRHGGRKFYGIMGGAMLVLGSMAAISEGVNNEYFSAIANVGFASMLVLFVAATWLGAFGFLRKVR